MALARSVVLLAFLVLPALQGTGARAGQPVRREAYQLVKEGCSLRVRSRNQWVASEPTFKTGQTVLGMLSDGAVRFYLEGKEFAGDPACWSSASALRKAAAPSDHGSDHQLGLIYLNWQERISLVAAVGGTSYPLRANQAGYGIYYQYERTLPGRPQGGGRMGAMLSVITAGSAVLTSTADSAALGGLTYKSLDASAFGIGLAPELGWERSGGGPSFGVSLPVLYRLTNWASPPDYEIQGSSRLLFGGLFAVRLRRPGWEVSSRLGFLQNTQNLAWVLGFGRML